MNSDTDRGEIKLIYVLLDGVGDLPHPDLDGTTPLQAANTPNMDKLARNGSMGQVISVGKGIAPQSDIAVFNMLGYNFKDKNYVGRGVIESIGCGIDFREGDLALRGNFATIDKNNVIIDRRAGRIISQKEAYDICKTLEEEIKINGTSISIKPTVAHRVTLRFRYNGHSLSSKITNTDPAYDKVNGMGIAKSNVEGSMVQNSIPEDDTEQSRKSAEILNEFTEKSIKILQNHAVNDKRIQEGLKPMNAILCRDSGNKFPDLMPIEKKYGLSFASIVDMPVEIGISKVLKMRAFEAGRIDDYELKAKVAAKTLEDHDAIYIHIKGPDEFGHDGNALGKKKTIEDIDKRFFGTLLAEIKIKNPTIVISGDHSTPCIKKAHSDDPVPLLVSGNRIDKDNSARFTEEYAGKGKIKLIMGSDVLTTSLKMIS